MVTRTPQVTWGQDKQKLYVTINVVDCVDPIVELQDQSLVFKGTANNEPFGFTLDLFDKVTEVIKLM